MPINAELIDKSLSYIDNIVDRIDRYKDKKLSSEFYLRAYYIEVVNNIEFLRTIKLEELSGKKPNSTGIKFIITRLETEIGASILLSSAEFKDTDLYKFLQNGGNLNNSKKIMRRADDVDEKRVKEKSFYENILQAVSFTVTKIEVLKKLSTMNEEEMETIKDLKLKSRIVNILERFIMIKKKLDEFKPIKGMVR